IVGQIGPRAADARDLRLPSEFALRAHFACDASHFRGKRIELVDHRVDGVFQLQDFALHVDSDLFGQVAARDGRRDLGDVAHLTGEVVGELVDVVGQILPRAADAGDVRLTTELAFRDDRARDASD